jgi:hypothetical protein
MRVFYMSAHVAARYCHVSKAFYERKRAEKKTHKQAVIALARRRNLPGYSYATAAHSRAARHSALTALAEAAARHETGVDRHIGNQKQSAGMSRVVRSRLSSSANCASVLGSSYRKKY